MNGFRCIRAFAVAVLAFVFAFSATGEKASASTFGERVVQSIFDNAAVSFHFDEDIFTVAQSYVRKTKYAGKIRVNQPLLPGFLNIYVFKRGMGFEYERFLGNTCRAFRDTEAIICDEDFLDSMPGSMPVLFEGGRDAVPPSALMYWGIGHEIGHIILKHKATAFSGGTLADRTDVEINGAEVSKTEKTPSQEESEADRFAISGMPIKKYGDWVYFGNPIMDALFWEMRKYNVGSNIDGSATAKPQIPIRNDNSGHPPLVTRLSALISTIHRNYSDFPFGDDFLPYADFVPSESAPKEYASPFYGDSYLGSEDGQFAHLTKLLDLATYMFVTAKAGQSGGILKVLCNSKPSLARVHEVQRAVVCGNELSGDIFGMLRNCAQLYSEASVRCYMLIPLIGMYCTGPQPNTSFSEICGDLPRLNSIYMTYAGHVFSGPVDANSLFKWAFLAQYTYQVSVVGKVDEVLLDWVLTAAGQEGFANVKSVGTELLLAHEITVVAKRPEDWISLANLSIALADRGVSLGNEDLAVAYQQKVVDLITKNMPPVSLEKAYHLLKLARIMRELQVHDMGSNDSLAGAIFDPDLAAALGYPTTDPRIKSGQLSEAAAEIYRASALALENTAIPDKDAIKAVRRVSYLNALGSAVFSYNMALAQDDALRVSLVLDTELATQKEARLVPEFEAQVLAPAYENIALAHIASPKGDGDLALDYGLKAISIRSRHNQDDLLARRIVSYAHFRLRNFSDAAREAEEYVNTYELSTHRRFPRSTGMTVAGGFVSVDDIFNRAELQVREGKER